MMKRGVLLLIVLFTLLMLPLLAWANQPAQGWCSVGGVRVSVSGLSSAGYVQASYPGCTVTVYNTGTTNLATIYADSISTPLANPFTANGTTGSWIFFAANGGYDVVLSGGGLSAPYTFSDVILFDVNAPTTVSNWTIDTANGNVIKLNGNTLTASAGTATLTFPNSTDTMVARTTFDTLSNKSLTSPTITGNPTILGVTTSTTTGTGSLVFSGSPALTTPNIGAATGSLTGSASQLESKTWEVPGTIGSTTPNTAVFTTATVASLNAHRFADQYAVGSTSGGIGEAITACGGSNCTVIIKPGYTATITATLNISGANVSLVCMSNGIFTNSAGSSQIAFNSATATINVTGKNFSESGCQFNNVTTADRTGVAMITGAVQGGNVQNSTVIGNGTTPNNGIFFLSTGSGLNAGGWNFTSVRIIDGNTWTAFIKITNSNNSTTSAQYNGYNVITANTIKFSDAGLVLDGTIDTFDCPSCGFSNSASAGKAVWLRNTVSSSGLGYPRWVHLFDFYGEGGACCGVTNGTVVQIDSGRDVNISGYMASAGTFVAVTGALMDVDLHDVSFTNSYGTAIALSSQALDVKIHHNTFSGSQQSAISYCGGGGVIIDHNTFFDSGLQTTNTYDTISVCNSTGHATIDGNTWFNTGTNKPRYGINIGTGTTNYIIGLNDYGAATFGTAFLLDSGSSTNKTIVPNTSGTTGVFTSPFNFANGFSAGASGTTITDTRNLVQAVYNHSGTAQLSTHVVIDTCTLGTSCSVTLTGSSVYTSSSSYYCMAIDSTAAAAIKFVPSSGSAFALTGTGTDVLSYICVGN